MKYLHAFCIAAAMYSRLPVPNVRWDEESKAMVLFFFPLLGVIEGGLLYGIARFLLFGRVSAPLAAFVMTAAPLLFTGGIHFDGFLDTVDALGSWKGKAEKLAIL
ncbi:adenosylcobinamide-GDP ribazoletransferase, partial [Stomatobaculum longum]